MGQPPEERERDRRDEDLFEDLDDFFAPLEDTGWPEGEEGDVPETPAPAADEPGEGTAALEDWDVAIDVPEADELLATSTEDEEPAQAGGEEEPAVVDEAQEEDVPEPVEAALGEEEGAEGPLSVDDLRSAPPAYADLPGPGEADELEEGEEAEEPLLPEEVTVDAEDLFEEEPSEPVEIPEAEVGAGPPVEEAPDPEAIEAAAEHFASGVRDTPDAVERDLLADLEGDEVPEPETVTVATPAP